MFKLGEFRMPRQGPVLLSWCARNNDPFERDRDGNYRADGKALPGPTLTLLFDPESTFCKKIEDVVLLFNEGPNHADAMVEKVVMQTIDAIRTKSPLIHCETRKLITPDPTDHAKIFEFLKEEVPKIRQQFVGREIIIHISPGTPAMQTVWVLMAECGFIAPPFTVVKSYRKGDRKGGKAVVPVNIGIETFYKVFQTSRPARTSTAEEKVQWDPAQFQSAKLVKLYEEARSFARLRVPVLITGERGTGKTTLANWIRANSSFCKPEHNNNWASVPCGQYTPETMRSELFGYVKGAFTGAEKDHDGLLKTADGDSLFLDEVGDISRDLQRLLIRAVEEGIYNRLGSTKTEKSTFRLITATNIGDLDLRKRLDPDFYDRIGGLRLSIPPLREVPEDLPWLWRSAFQTALQRCGMRSPFELSSAQHDQVVKQLLAHHLNGNIRDLIRVANRVIARLADSPNVNWSEVLTYAIACLTEDSPSSSLSQEIAKAFVAEERLDSVLEIVGRLEMRPFEADIRAYLATELRRLAAERKVDASTLCDVSSRTLRDWAARKNISGSRQ
jgi:transcriptional regulator with AAA-type ATPase domain